MNFSKIFEKAVREGSIGRVQPIQPTSPPSNNSSKQNNDKSKGKPKNEEEKKPDKVSYPENEEDISADYQPGDNVDISG